MDSFYFWVIIAVSVIGLSVVGGLIYFGFTLYRRYPERLIIDLWHDWVDHHKSPDSNLLTNITEEYLSRRNEFLALSGQFVVAVFVAVCITILLLAKVISAEAGLPILSAIAGFAIGKGVTIGKTTLIEDLKNENEGENVGNFR